MGRLRWAAAAIRVCSVLTIVGCQSSPDALLSRELEDGRPIRALLSDSGKTAVLVYSAATCFGCGTPIAEWRVLGAAGRVRVALVLVGAVSDADWRAFRLQRVPVAGVLASSPTMRITVPSEYLVEHGQIIAKAEGLAAIRSRRFSRDSLLFPPDRKRMGRAE